MLDESRICQAVKQDNICWRDTYWNNNEETFLICRDGAVQTVLPGKPVSQRMNAIGLITILRDVTVQGSAGAYDISCAHDRAIGGWCSFRCRLLSARRYAKRFGGALLQGQSVQDTLTICVRQALTDVFVQMDPATPYRQIWMQSKRLTEERLLDCGWQLKCFTPQRLIEGERK